MREREEGMVSKDTFRIDEAFGRCVRKRKREKREERKESYLQKMRILHFSIRNLLGLVLLK